MMEAAYAPTPTPASNLLPSPTVATAAATTVAGAQPSTATTAESQQQQPPSSAPPNAPDGSAESPSTDTSPGDDDDGDTATTRQQRARENSLDQLAQIELRRRRSSIVFLLLFFLLIRLWMQALMTGDGGWILFCLVLTVWMNRMHQARRAEEEDAARQWNEVLYGSRENADAAAEREREEGRSEILDGMDPRVSDFQNMSFQMQMALAMMESRRIMALSMRNGGMPPTDEDGRGARSPGVSESRRGEWEHFAYGRVEADDDAKGGEDGVGAGDLEAGDGANGETTGTGAESKEEGAGPPSSSSSLFRAIQRRAGGRRTSDAGRRSRRGYDNINDLEMELTLEDGGEDEHVNGEADEKRPAASDKGLDDDDLAQKKKGDSASMEGTCSICLQEYERGDELVRLPCRHVYHEDCVAAWVANHVRCPLCNYDLEEGNHSRQ